MRTEAEVRRRRVLRIWFAVVGGISAALLYGHTFYSSRWNVDSVSLGLVGLLLLLPIADRITKIRLGEFEAEFTREQAERKVEEARSETQALPRIERVTEAVETERQRFQAWSTAFDDAGKASAADRIDLERSLRRVAELAEVEIRRPGSMRQTMEALERAAVVDRSAVAAISDVLPVLTAAAHGEIVDWSLAYEMHTIVEQLIGYFEVVAQELLDRSSDLMP